MSDRVKGFTVVLEKSIREDEAENLLMAISQLKGVLTVSPVIEDSNSVLEYLKVRTEMRDKLYKLIQEL